MSDFPNKIAPLWEICPQKGANLRFIYRGNSMVPTLSPGQIIYVNDKSPIIESGDVIVFLQEESECRVVHRVISKSPDGFLTRGDNNLYADEFPVAIDRVIGRVEKVDHSGRSKRITNGRCGRYRAQFLRQRLLIKRKMRHILSQPYQWLKRRGVVTKIWKPKIVIIYFNTQDGPLVKYLHKGKTVANYWATADHWWCKRPYDLVINPEIKCSWE